MKNELKRQAMHVCGIFLVPFALFVGKPIAVASFFAASMFFLVYGAVIKKSRKESFHSLEEKMRKFLLGFERSDEPLFMGAGLFFLGFSASFLLFPEMIASAACIILSLGDAASTLVGKKFGRHVIMRRKTLEGSISFFIFSFLSATFFVQAHVAFVGAFAGMLAEILSWPDDNITVPVISGLAMQLTGEWLFLA